VREGGVGSTGGDSGKGGGAAFGIYRLGRRITRLPILGAMVPAGLRAAVQRRLLGRAFDRMPDRRYMVEVLLPAVAALGPRRLLDVGVQGYTSGYGRRLPDDSEYWTLDVDPGVAPHGSPGRHIVGNALDLASHFAPGSLDVVMMNGVFGFGIDRLDDQGRAIAATRTVLRPGGWLLVGWDRAADGSPVVMGERGPDGTRIEDPLELEGIRSGFDHQAPPGLRARVDFADCSHVYDWFRARESSPSAPG
jgi:hypothetical protein